jgi:hypothetical protein
MQALHLIYIVCSSIRGQYSQSGSLPTIPLKNFKSLVFPRGDNDLNQPNSFLATPSMDPFAEKLSEDA